MGKAVINLFRKVIEHKADIFIGLAFFSVGFFLYIIWKNASENMRYNLIMPSIVGIGLLLAWIQFLSNKSTQRKEAALTYYPRPMELEKIENDIDMVIQFWSSGDAMASHEVKLMLDEEINDIEYELCWQRLSDSIKRDIVDIYESYYKSSSEESDKCITTNDRLSYIEGYNGLIKEKFIDVRRKFHLYLNQIEGFCLALNKGNIDSKTAKDMYVHKLNNHFRKAKPYIDAVRRKRNEPEIYIQFERVIDKWKS